MLRGAVMDHALRQAALQVGHDRQGLGEEQFRHETEAAAAEDPQPSVMTIRLGSRPVTSSMLAHSYLLIPCPTEHIR